MTLLELLRQELPKRGGWPEGVHGISTHADGQVFFDGRLARGFTLPKASDAWNRREHPHTYTNAVTREQYEATGWDGTGLPPVSYLKSVLDYDEETGDFTWKPRIESDFSTKCQFVSWSNRFAGKKAGTIVTKKRKSYLKINLGGKNYYAHRIAYAILNDCWPENEIDHINGNSLDNSKTNLRQVTRKENCRNVSLIPNSTSGYCGVNWHEPSGKWRARVKIDGKENYIGLFDDPQEAAIRIKAIRDAVGFHKNHGQDLRTEAERTIDEMVRLSGVSIGAAKILYDAGYRKG
ncbi:HNH endonuclease [Klebsiella phage vB_KleM_KB2]|uniref:HNH endonuclease n=1 Tax=Klebsiella phage vB_KleM_KB2 TaxID=2759197 RepID=A0AAE7J0L5_9CAUD|nr:HNH endonuclease [Klebsiella phage vB_KleM_KB2]QNI20518.1 HNH endonuclease [Klebsiella phage vB_KleM_KB2]